jgi:anthranilate phosphoribosyltransferase
VNIDLSPDACVRLLRDIGICFLFAQKYHASMKHVGAIRKELGFRTVFNILGPLTNPARPSMQLLGVYDPLLVEPLAQVLSGLGVRRGMVFCGGDRMDELSVGAPARVCEFREGAFSSYELHPARLGFRPCGIGDLAGGDPQENACVTIGILNGETGAKRDVVLLNAGAGLYIADKAASIEAGIALAAELIDGGAAYRKLQEFKEASSRT